MGQTANAHKPWCSCETLLIGTFMVVRCQWSQAFVPGCIYEVNQRRSVDRSLYDLTNFSLETEESLGVRTS